MQSLRDFVKANKFIVAAHRGDSAHYPENTISAFQSAVRVGADMIETDIHCTKDGVIVVHHNMAINELKANIHDLYYSDFKDLSAGAWFSDEFKNEKIPLLSQLFELAKDKIYLNIEIKKPASTDFETFIDELVRQIETYSNPEQVILASYYYDMLGYLKTKYPYINTAGIRIPSHSIMPLQLKSMINIDAYICSLSGIDKEISSSAEKADTFLGVYSVDNLKHFEKARKYNVTALGTNKPKELIEIINNSK